MVKLVRQHKNTIKPCTYSVMHMVVAIAVAFAISGSWAVALSIGLIEPIVQTFAYIFHEKIWAKAEVVQPIHPLP